LALLIDYYNVGVVTYGGLVGAGIPAALLPQGIPEVPLATGMAGVEIAELSVQSSLRAANNLALLGTLLTFVADTKAGNTRMEQGVIGSDVVNSFTLTMAGYAIPEAYTSAILQSVAVRNDLTSISFPWPNWSNRP
jgi:hypothetical protein